MKEKVTSILIIGCLSVFPGCSENESESGSSAEDVSKGAVGNGQPVSLSSPPMLRSEYETLARRAESGDAEAAFDLYNAFTYSQSRDYGLAYFWCSKALALGEKRLSPEDLELAEKNILNEAIRDNLGESIEIEGILPE